MQSESRFFAAPDGVQLAWHEVGEGRPVVLIHGLFSSARMNWIKFGHAAAIAAKGFRVIMPDLRAHGDSGKPREASAYPADVTAADARAVRAALPNAASLRTWVKALPAAGGMPGLPSGALLSVIG